MSALISLDFAKTVLRIDSANTADDALLTALVAGVSQAIKTYCRRDLVPTHYVELYDGTGSVALLLRHFPLISLNSVVVDASSSAPTTCTAAGFQLRPAIGQIIFKPDVPMLGGLVPRFVRGRANIQVDYSAGFDPIPDDLQLATVLAVGNLYHQPDLTKQREKIGASYYYIGRPGDLAFTPEIKTLLNAYREAVP